MGTVSDIVKFFPALLVIILSTQLLATEDSDGFFIMQSHHARLDKSDPKSIKRAEFEVKFFVKEYSLASTIPKHLPIQSIKLLRKSLDEIVYDKQDSDNKEKYSFLNQMEKDRVTNVIQNIDWNNDKVSVFATVPYKNGKVHSPAFNSLWLIKDKYDDLKLYIFISADSKGNPETRFIGLNFNESFSAPAKIKFSPLSYSDNIFKYKLCKSGEGLFFLIECFNKKLSPFPYIVVSSYFTPASSKEIKLHKRRLHKAIPSLNILKGLLGTASRMYEILKIYFPAASSAELFNRVEIEIKHNIIVGSFFGYILHFWNMFHSHWGQFWLVPPTSHKLSE